MKKAPTYLAAIAALLFAGIQAQAQTNLANLGSDNFTVDEGGTTVAYTQSTTSLNLTNPTIALGETLGGVFSTPYNWSAYSNTNNFAFGLLMSAPGASPSNVPFTIEFFNGALDAIVNTYQGSASGLGTSPTFIPVELSLPGTGDFSSIGGMQFTWDGGGTGAVVIDSVGVAVVPEPSTWAMLVFGGALVIFVASRRRSLAKARQ